MLNIPVRPGRLIPKHQQNLLTSALARQNARYSVEFPAKSESNAHFMLDLLVVLHAPKIPETANILGHLLNEPQDVQADVLMAVFGLHETYLDTVRSQQGTIFLFAHGVMFVHWDNVKAGKGYEELTGRADDVSDNFDLRYFGQTHHDKINFIADVKRALSWHKDKLENGFELVFPSHC